MFILPYGNTTSSGACKALTQPLVISSMACWKINPFSSVLFPLKPSKTYIYKKMFNCHACWGVSPFPIISHRILEKQRQNGSEPGFPCTALTTAADSRGMWHDARAGSITQLLIYAGHILTCFQRPSSSCPPKRALKVSLNPSWLKF